MRTILGAILVAGLMANPVSAAPPQPQVQVEASVDCAHFDVSVSGLNVGDSVIVGHGSQPPMGFTVGGPYDAWTPIDSGATGTVTVGLYESTHSFYATITFAGPGDPYRLFEQFVDCDIPEPEPVTVLPATTAPAFEPSALWSGLELADPW